MIQSPQMQYVPVNGFAQTANQNQTAYSPVQYAQAPGVIYNYPQSSCYLPQAQQYDSAKSQYNGVNIEIINPQGQAGVPCQAYNAQTAVPVNYVPYQAPVYQPVQQPQAVQTWQTAQPSATVPAPQIQTMTPVSAQPVQQVQQPQPAQQVQAAQPVVEQSQQNADDSFIESFMGRLKSNDFDVQHEALEDIARTVKDDSLTEGNILLDSQIYDALVEMVNQDTSELEGPPPEVIELRQKPEDELSAEEKAKAVTLYPSDKATMNKAHALCTIGFMDRRLNNEFQKQKGAVLKLNELPCIETIINAIKDNPRAEVRECAIDALACLAMPEYKGDFTTIYTLALNDGAENVREEAQKALDALESI